MSKWLQFPFLIVSLATAALLAAALLSQTETPTALVGLTHLAHKPGHLLALVALGVWSGRLSGPARLTMPVSFVVGLALGFLVGASQPVPEAGPFIQLAVLVSTLALIIGASLALAVPSWEATGTLMSLGILQGYVDGVEAGVSAPLSGVSFLLTAIALLALGAGLGHAYARGS